MQPRPGRPQAPAEQCAAEWSLPPGSSAACYLAATLRVSLGGLWRASTPRNEACLGCTHRLADLPTLTAGAPGMEVPSWCCLLYYAKHCQTENASASWHRPLRLSTKGSEPQHFCCRKPRWSYYREILLSHDVVLPTTMSTLKSYLHSYHSPNHSQNNGSSESAAAAGSSPGLPMLYLDTWSSPSYLAGFQKLGVPFGGSYNI